MLFNYFIGLFTMVICLLLQILLLVVVLRMYSRRIKPVNELTISYSLLIISVIMIILVVGNLAQIIIWGYLFLLLGEFELLSQAVYHSAVNFTTLGYGDIVMSAQYRLLGPLEAINGVLMIGVSTAVLMAVFQDLLRKKRDDR